jgi:type II secretory pathway pseudopilin PulG
MAAVPVFRDWAFTLVELLIAVSVLSLLAGLMFAVLNATSILWQTTEKGMSSFREARAALSVMSREISASYQEPGRRLQMMVINPNDSVVQQPQETARDHPWGSRIFLLSTLSSRAQTPGANRSDVCAVGYYLAFTRDRTAFSPIATGAGSSSYKLFRHLRSSDEVFTTMNSSLDPRSLFLPSTAPNEDEVLASNVTRFEIRVFAKNVDASSGAMLGLREFDLEAGSWPTTEKPGLMEIALTALNDGTAAKLTTKADWENHSSPLQKRDSQRFSLWVNFPE